MQNPKFVLSKSRVLEQYNKVKELADYVSYSSKTNPIVTKILEKETYSMFSIHLQNELKNVEDKSRVLFLAQAWNQRDITKLIKEYGIKWFVVDNESDLDTLIECLKRGFSDEKINLFLRLKLKEYTLKTERYFVFGMTSDVVKKRLKELRENKNIDKLGIHFHRKTQNMSEWDYEYEISKSLGDVFPIIDVINMGGGLPSEYANTNIDVIQTIFDKIKEFRKFLKQHNIELMLEPGRFISASAVKLITHIVGIHDNTIIVNASVYNSDMDALIVPVKLLVEGEGTGEPYIIKGITPCSMDIFRYRVYLKAPKIGDKIIFLNAGAYNFRTDFCDLDEIPTEIIE